MRLFVAMMMEGFPDLFSFLINKEAPMMEYVFILCYLSYTSYFILFFWCDGRY